jgi:prepilin-type N-terminal cleavage/methylation domain-containing protein
MRKGEKGFTLIELLVVISIQAVLAGVVVLNVTQFIGRGACEAAATEKANMTTAIAAFGYENVGAAYPTTQAGYAAYLLTTPHGVYTINASTGAITSYTYAGCASPP